MEFYLLHIAKHLPQSNYRLSFDMCEIATWDNGIGVCVV